MSETLPIQCSAHHASADFGQFSDRCALTEDQRVRFSDYGTADTVPWGHESGETKVNFHIPLVAYRSRGLVDLNRAPESDTLFREVDFAKPTPNRIWKPGQAPTEEEKLCARREIYEFFHGQMLVNIRNFDRPGLVVAWDNTAHYEIGKNEAGQMTMMRPFILSNKGAEGSTDVSEEARGKGEVTTCDPGFLTEFAMELRKSLKKYGLPDEVFLNLVYKGGYVPEHYNTRRHPEIDVPQAVQSFQVEYDTILTHDQQTLERDSQKMVQMRLAFERALYNSYTNLLTHTV